MGRALAGLAMWKLENWGIGACGRRCLPLRGKVRAVPGDEVWVCCSLTAAHHPVAGTHFARKRRLGRPCVRCLAPLGQGALPVCVFDAVCPCGAKALQSWRAGFWPVHGKEFFAGAFCPSGNFPGAPGKRSCGAHLIAFAFRGEYSGRGIRSRPFFSPFTSFSRPQKAIFPPSPPPHPPRCV